MNPVQQKLRIDYHCDKVKNPRYFIDTSYVPALNIAMTEFIRDRYDNIKKQQKTYGYETSQSLKDDLRTITKPVNIIPVNNVLAYPADYHHELTLYVTINGKRVPSTPMTHNEKGAIYENQNTRPSPEFPRHYEDQNGITVLYGGFGIFTSADMDYLREPKEIVMMAASPDRTQLLSIAAGPGVLTIGAEYYVLTAAVHNAINYAPGTTFIAQNADLTSGTVSFIVSCELPKHTHEEISLMAAASLTGRALNLLKTKLLQENADSK